MLKQHIRRINLTAITSDIVNDEQIWLIHDLQNKLEH